MAGGVAIIGAGHAGVLAAAHLREQGFSGRINIFSEEQELPYQRPPLSKGFLAGTMSAKRLLLRGEIFYQEYDVGLHLEQPVLSLDREAKKLQTAAGEHSYDIAIMATGGKPKRFASDLEGLFYLHRMAESRELRKALENTERLVIIGGGYIGLEVAATARQMGLSVVVVEAAERILARVAAPEISEFFTHYHRQQGVRIELGVQVQLEGSGRIRAVKTEQDVFETDLVLVGIGMNPEIELARAAGLQVDQAIIVDQNQLSSDPSIYAIGDCTHAYHRLYQRRVRLESVQNAAHQAHIVASAICKTPLPPIETPWFWSDQYDIKLQIAGLAQNYNRTIVRGDKHSKAFVVFYLAGDQLLAADCINRPQEFLMTKRALAAKSKVDVEKLKNQSLSVKEIFS